MMPFGELVKVQVEFCNTKLNFIVLKMEVSHHGCFRLDL